MFSANLHRYIFLFGLIGLAAGMLFGTVPTSIPQIILAINWLLENNFRWKWHTIKANNIFWVLISVFLLHVIGMSYTENVGRGLDDLRNKMPLIILPLILLSTKPLSDREFKFLFYFFFLAVFISSVYCYAVYAGLTKKIIFDVRKASVFMSHIRFSLFIAFAVIALIYWSLKEKSIIMKLICISAVPWFLFFMYKLEMATGFLCLISVGLLLLIVFSLKQLPKTISVMVLMMVLFFVVIFINKASESFHMFDKITKSPSNILLQKTKNGRQYLQDTIFGIAENGTLITININDEELQQEWNKRSNIAFNSFDNKGNNLRYTLLRYLASKGFTKDSVGVSNLSNQDIKYIENGISNYKYSSNSGLVSRWREMVWEYTKYKRGENPSGHTLTMRLEFWKTGSYIVRQNPIIGVGTGDIQNAFDEMYKYTNSKLDLAWRLRCHNQYLAIAVAFGFVGLAVFLFYLFYPAFVLRKKLHYLYWSFFLIALLSFITEDTLETQSGVTFFIFFQTLFLWLASFNNSNESIQTN